MILLPEIDALICLWLRGTDVDIVKTVQNPFLGESSAYPKVLCV